MHPLRPPISQKPGAANVRFHAVARPLRRTGWRGGFTLLEVLVSIAILAMLMVLVAAIFNSSSRLWKSAETKVSAFQSARAAVETISRRLGQATLPWRAGIQPHRRLVRRGSAIRLDLEIGQPVRHPS